MTSGDLTTTGGFATGCNYWASHAGTMMWTDWRPEVVNDDLRQLAASELTTIRVFPLWPVFQPLTQTYGGNGVPHDLRIGEAPLPDTAAGRAGVNEESMERFAFLADRAEEHGLSLIVGLVTGWMSGRLFVPPAFERLNVLTDPFVRRWTIRFVRYFVSRMKDKPAIRYWDLGNECNCMAPVESCDRAYEWTAAVAGAIRLEDASRPVVSGMHSLRPGATAPWRIQDQGELTDLLTTHPYPIFTPHCNQEPVNTIRNAFHATAESRFYADIGQTPCFAEELGTLGPEVASEDVASSYLRNALFNLWAHDCRGMLWWCAYDQDRLSHAPYDWNGHERELGLFRADRSAKPMALAIAEFARARERSGIESLPLFRREAVCILTEGQDQWGVAFASFILAKQAGFDLEFRYTDQPIPEAELYIVPSAAGANCISARLHKTLLERVARGASLYLSHDGCFLGWFESTFGVRIRARIRTPSVVNLELDGEPITIAGEYRLLLDEAGADVLARDRDGNPVYTRHAIGDGSVYLLSAPLEKHVSSTPDAFTRNCTAASWRIYAAISSRARSGRACSCADPMVSLTEHRMDDNSRLVVAVNNAPDELACTITVANGWHVSSVPIGRNLNRIAGNDGIVVLLKRSDH